MSQLDTLLMKIGGRTYTVYILWLGYVRFLLIWTFHQRGMPMPIAFDNHHELDISYIEQISDSVFKNLCKGQFMILEFTTWPGITEVFMIPILEKKTGKNFYLVYSSELEDLGNPYFNMPEYIVNVDELGTPSILEAVPLLGMENKTKINSFSLRNSTD